MPLAIFAFFALTGLFASVDYPSPPPAEPVKIPCVAGCSVGPVYTQAK